MIYVKTDFLREGLNPLRVNLGEMNTTNIQRTKTIFQTVQPDLTEIQTIYKVTNTYQYVQCETFKKV